MGKVYNSCVLSLVSEKVCNGKTTLQVRYTSPTPALKVGYTGNNNVIISWKYDPDDDHKNIF